jgi:hypothetical protein
MNADFLGTELELLAHLKGWFDNQICTSVFNLATSTGHKLSKQSQKRSAAFHSNLVDCNNRCISGWTVAVQTLLMQSHAHGKEHADSAAGLIHILHVQYTPVYPATYVP